MRILDKDQLEEIKYLEIRDNPEYRDLRLLEKRDVEDKAIIRAQARFTLREDVTPIVDKLFEALSHADFSNGVGDFGADEGRIRAWEFIKQLEDEWKALIK